MITVISGTNRKDSLTKSFAEKYCELISNETEQKVNFLALEDLPHDWFSEQMYNGEKIATSLADIQDQYILPAKSFVIICPEYNGSFPGVIKMFIDACSVRKYEDNFKAKKVGFIGVAAGRAGNLRGMGQLAAIFNHLGAVCFPNQLPVSDVGKLLDKTKRVTDQATLQALTDHATGFVAFVA